MKLTKYKITLTALKSQVNFNYFIIFSLIIVVFLLSAKLFSTKETVVVLPPHFTEEIRVSGNKANSSYAKSWGLFFSTLLGNVAPKTADFTADSILKYMSVELQKKASSLIGEAVLDIQEKSITRLFTPKGIVYEPLTNKVFVSGTVDMIDSYGTKKSSGNQTYEYIIQIKHGYPKIVSFNTYSGVARTQKVLFRMKRLEDQKALKDFESGVNK